jgi:hypothetical protein
MIFGSNFYSSFFCFDTKNEYFNSLLHFFVLIQKNEAKKIKTVPASLKKLALEQLNRPNSQLRCSDKDDS